MSYDRRDYDRDLQRRDDLRDLRARERRQFSDALRRGIVTGDYSGADYHLGVPPEGAEELADPNYYPDSAPEETGRQPESPGAEAPASDEWAVVRASQAAVFALAGGCSAVPLPRALAWQNAVATLPPGDAGGALAVLEWLAGDVQRAAVEHAPAMNPWSPDPAPLLEFQAEMEALWQGLLGLHNALQQARAAGY